MSETELPRILALDGPEHRQVLEGPPSIPGQYLHALTLAGRPQGAMADGAEAALGPIAIERPGCLIDADLVARHREICGYAGGGGVPSAFMETLFQGLMVQLILSPPFPFSPFGVIHLGQRMRWRRLLEPGASVDCACTLAALRETRRGFEVECAMLASQQGEPVWEGLATLISRSKATRRGGSKRKSAAVKGEPGGWCEPALLEVPGDTGRRYAAVSGDYNPFHLYGFLAKLFGFPRPIAHGMWTLARALAWLEEQQSVPGLHHVDVSFKRPLLMPGSVALRWREVEVAADEQRALALEVRHATKEQPHLVGRVAW